MNETKTITYKGKTVVCKYWKGMCWDKELTDEMKKFEEETKKNAIWKGEITGSFVYWLYWKPSKNKVKKPIIKKSKKVKRVKLYKPAKQIKQKVILKEQKRMGTTQKPVIEKHTLNGVEVKYNWTEGQLYLNDEVIGEPDTKYGRDLLKLANIRAPKISIDELQKFYMYNYDIAIKNGWTKCANTYIEYMKVFRVHLK